MENMENMKSEREEKLEYLDFLYKTRASSIEIMEKLLEYGELLKVEEKIKKRQSRIDSILN